MNSSTNNYLSAADWIESNWASLKDYVGEWVAYSKDGVIAHDPDYRMMMSQVQLDPQEYIIERVFENEFVEPIKFYPVRFRTVKASNWQPKYIVSLKYQQTKTIRMLVDSGADFCLMTKQLGLDLGYQIGTEEVMAKAEGIGGEINYVLREVELSIDGHVFNAPIAWIQADAEVDYLLGREVVFDQFDIEFKQVDKKIIFRFRS